MNMNQIKKYLQTSKLTKPALIVMSGLLLLLYFSLYFTIGISYQGKFLKKHTTSSERTYEGSDEYGDILIRVTGIKDLDPSADVIYQTTNDIAGYYTVEFINAKDWDAGIKVITDMDENILFEGVYEKKSNAFNDRNGKPYFDFVINTKVKDNIVTIMYSNTTCEEIAAMVYESNEIILGEGKYLVIAILILLITWIDYRFPLFFFRLSYGWAVYNPEPSDSYLFWQKIRWIFNLIFVVFLMIIAL